jgi:dihydropteroate synthase
MNLNINGYLYSLEEPKIMGILNATPDSFYKQSRLSNNDDLNAKVDQMAMAGVDIFDIGGYSTRPGAVDISIEEEICRVIPFIKIIVEKYPDTLISIDTFRSEVARESINAGAHIVNDISGGDLDDRMFETIVELNVPYILMHMRGNPQTMSKEIAYKNVTAEVIFELSQKVNKLRGLGVKDIIIDPGFGFAKTIEQNFELLENLELLNLFELPILVGLSRKSMIWKSLKGTAEDALNGTSILNTKAVLKGARILRVHDVLEASELKKLLIKNVL